jgi:hypothetical protein
VVPRNIPIRKNMDAAKNVQKSYKKYAQYSPEEKLLLANAYVNDALHSRFEHGGKLFVR